MRLRKVVATEDVKEATRLMQVRGRGGRCLFVPLGSRRDVHPGCFTGVRKLVDIILLILSYLINIKTLYNNVQ